MKSIVFNILFGQEVTILIDELKPAGIHEVKFHLGLNLTPGLYFYSIISEDFVSTKVMLLLK